MTEFRFVRGGSRRAAAAAACLALAVIFSACGANPPAAVSPSSPPSSAPTAGASVSPASGKAAFTGEWITYAAETKGGSSVFEDFADSSLIKLSGDGVFTMESRVYGDYKLGSWKPSADGISAALEDGAGDTVFTLKLTGPGETTASLAPAAGGGASPAAARTDSARGRAALRLREAQLRDLSGSNEDTQRTFTAYVSPGADSGSLSFDMVVWVNGSDTDSLALFGIDPSCVMDDYAIYDGDADSFDYTLDPRGKFTVYSDTAKSAADAAGLIKAVNAHGGRMLAKVTTHGEMAVSVEQIYVP